MGIDRASSERTQPVCGIQIGDGRREPLELAAASHATPLEHAEAEQPRSSLAPSPSTCRLLTGTGVSSAATGSLASPFRVIGRAACSCRRAHPDALRWWVVRLELTFSLPRADKSCNHHSSLSGDDPKKGEP